MPIDLEYVDCNICGSSKNDKLYEVRDWWLDTPEKYFVVKCCDCDLVYLNPRPKQSEFHKLYPDFFYSTDQDVEKLQNSWKTEVNKVKAEYLTKKSPGSIYDIGAYWGEFLKYMQENGWSVRGCELSSQPDDLFNVNIFNGPLNIDSGSFDAVTAWAVLEHVCDPLSVCRKVNHILKENGEFVFCIPNYNSIGAKLRWGDEYPRHMYFFDKNSVAKLADASGFELEYIDYDDRIFQFSAYGVLEFQLRKNLDINLEEFLLEKRSFKELQKRSTYTFNEKVKDAGLFWSGVRVIDKVSAPIIDKISKCTGHYGTMIVRYRKRKNILD
ncbi:MAG: class I SAM-dependent methyltransferase [Planctomycetota bacterium]|jgi:SAM-dependent methyltransferase